MGDRERPRQESRSRDDAGSLAQECRGAKGPRVRGSGLVDGLSNTGPWRAIAERLVESYAVNRDLLVLFDNNEIQSAKDFMKALGKRCDDASAFRALADMAIQGLPSEDKFAFTKAARFQEMSLFRDTINAQQLASCLHDLDNLGLKNEQRDNAMKLASEIGSKQGFGTVDSNLVLNSAAGDAVQLALQAKEPVPSQDPVSRSFEFENKSMQQPSPQTLSRSVFSGESMSNDHPDLTRFMIARDTQMRANGPAEKALTTLESAALMGERKESSGMPVPDMDAGIQGKYGQNQGYGPANGSPLDRPVLDGKQDERSGSPDKSSISDEAIERIKSFFANALGIERRQPFDRDDGPDFQGKGPSSSPPIKCVQASQPTKVSAASVRKAFALPLQPPEPLTFRLRGGRFVTANSVAAIGNAAPGGQPGAKDIEKAPLKPPANEKKADSGLTDGKKPAIVRPDKEAENRTGSAALAKSVKKKEKKERIGILAKREKDERSARKKAIASDHARNEKTKSPVKSRTGLENAAARRADPSSPGQISKPDKSRRGKSGHPNPSPDHKRRTTAIHSSVGHPKSRSQVPGKHEGRHGDDHGKNIKSGAKAAAMRKKENAARQQRKTLMRIAGSSLRKKSRKTVARK